MAKTIVIVDDEQGILHVLQTALETEGVQIETYSEIEPVEERLHTGQIDLLIADIRLSGVLGREGLELLSYVQKTSPDTKVIIMTAYGSEEIMQEAYDRGAYHYYNKPVDIIDLREKVAALGIATP